MKRRDQQGGSLIEFAIIAPLLFLILFGITEFGILLFDKAMLTNASREGARAGIVFNAPNRITNTEIIQVVTNYCETHLISFDPDSALTVTITRNGSGPGGLEIAGDPLIVTVNYPFQFLSGGTTNISAETVMRLE